jgi:CO/xanthine dehydrogenase Mo-binding subunit
LAEALPLPKDLAVTPRLSRWLRIDPDGGATVTPGKVEIGQGVLTALTQIMAEELDLAPERVRMVAASTAFSPDEGVTSSSLSIQECGAALAQVGAEARALLIDAAARRLGAAPADLTVEDGVVIGPGNLRIGYGDLAGYVDLDRDADGLARPKLAGSHRVRGRSTLRIDIPGRVFATRPYIHDLRLPDMAHGRILRPPFAHARLVDLNDAAARAVPGFLAIARDGDFLGVLAETEAAAEICRDRLAAGAVWERTAELPDAADLAGWLRSAPAETRLIDRAGAAGPASRTVAREYLRPFIAHASIGPCCAVARIDGDGLRVWTHSQGVYNLRADLAMVFGMEAARIIVEHVEGAGCYGHNGADDVALEAALLALSAGGRPVRLQWTRAEELTAGPLGPAQLVRIEADLDADGEVRAWRHMIWSNGHTARPGRADTPALRAATLVANGWAPLIPRDPPQSAGGGADRNAIPIYDFPAHEVVSHRLLTMPVRVSALRALGAFANVFAIESFMDELAAEAGEDPLAFRLRHLSDARAASTLRAAAEDAGWGRAPAEGRGLGLGVARYKSSGAWCAAVAEARVDEDVTIERLWLAADVGEAVNPDGARNQIEGGAIQATSWMLKEAARFDRERLLSQDWEAYPILRFSEVPRTSVRLIAAPGSPPLGAGECALGPVAGAVANAVAAALGVRVRRAPIDRAALIEAMELVE